MKFNKLTTAILSTTFLAACGGGGGGGSSEPVTVTAALTSANQDIAAQEAASTVLTPLELTDLSKMLVGAQTTDESALFKFAFEQRKKIPTYLLNASRNNDLIGATQTEIYPCTISGSLTVSASVANANGDPSAGDSVTVSSNGCTESDGTISGSLGFAISSLSGNFDTDYYNASITLSFNNLTIASTGYIIRANGSLTLAEAANGFNNLNQQISTPSLSISETYSGETVARTLANYLATVTTTPDANNSYVTSYNISGKLTSSALASQTITFNSTVPFIERSIDYYPSSGVLMINGAANSQLRLTALNSSQVKQELDANGDGTFEESKTINWSSLL